MNQKKHVVSFSGGRTSAYLCYLMKQKHGDNVDFIYMDTGAEHKNTYSFIKNVNREFNLNLTCIRLKINPVLGKANSYEIIPTEEIKPDLKPWVDMTKKYGTPYLKGPFCTDRMKLVPYEKYCNEKYGKKSYITWLGIRADEPRRLKERKDVEYLASISDFDKQDVLEWWSEQPFDLDLEDWLGNCVFCIKKGLNKIALAAKDEPELAEQFIKVITHKNVRILESRNYPSEIMYRGKNSLESVIKIFSDTSREEIISKLRTSKQLDTGSCSESCEAIQ